MADNDPTRIARQSRALSLLTGATRFFGLGRDILLTSALGLSPLADAFALAFALPSLARRLLSEGTLAAHLVPLQVRLMARRPKAAARLASRATLLTLLVTMAAILPLGLALWGLLPNGPLRLWSLCMLPFLPCAAAGGVAMSLLHARHKTLLPGLAPPLLNVCMIAPLATGLWLGWTPAQLGLSAAIGVLVGGLLQTLFLGWAAAQGLPAKPTSHSIARSALWRIARQNSTVLLVLGIPHLMLALDLLWSKYISHFHDSSWSGLSAALANAQRLTQLPLGIFGVAVGIVALPHLSKITDTKRLHHTLQYALRLGLFLALPAAAGLAAIALPLIRTLFEQGQFSQQDSHTLALCTLGYSLLIPLWTLHLILSRALVATQRTSRALLPTLCALLGGLILTPLAAWQLGPVGIPLANALCIATLCFAHSKLLPGKFKMPLRAFSKPMLASLIMGAPLFLITTQYTNAPRHTQALLTAALVVAGILTYTILTRILRCKERQWLLSKHPPSDS